DLDEYYLATFNRVTDSFRSRRRADKDAVDETWSTRFLPALHWLAALGGPVAIDELAAWLLWDQVTLAQALDEIAPFAQIDRKREEIRLEHSAVATFLQSPVLPGRRHNPYGMEETELHEMVLARVTDRLANEWNSSWSEADAVAAAACAHHLNRLV